MPPQCGYAEAAGRFNRRADFGAMEHETSRGETGVPQAQRPETQKPLTVSGEGFSYFVSTS